MIFSNPVISLAFPIWKLFSCQLPSSAMRFLWSSPLYLSHKSPAMLLGQAVKSPSLRSVHTTVSFSSQDITTSTPH